MNKTIVYIGAGVGGVIGGYLGSLLDNGNFLGIWGILLSLVGGLFGIWIGVKIQQ